MNISPKSWTPSRSLRRAFLLFLATLAVSVSSSGRSGAKPLLGIQELANRVAIQLDRVTREPAVRSDLAAGVWSKAFRVHAKAVATNLTVRSPSAGRSLRRYLRRYDDAVRAYLALAERARSFEETSRALYLLVTVLQEFAAPFCPVETEGEDFDTSYSCACDLLKERALIVALIVASNLLRTSVKHNLFNRWTNRVVPILVAMNPDQHPLFKAGVYRFAGATHHRLVTIVSRAGRTMNFAKTN